MSNLVAAPGQSPDVDSHNRQTVRVRDLRSSEIGNTDDEIDLRELWQALQRRRKFVAVTAGGNMMLASLFTTYQRIFRPVYEGSFSLLITDPISNEGDGRSAMANGEGMMFEQLARNTTSNDLPTLIEVLQSQVLLQPVADQFDLSTDELISRIAISTGGAKRKEAEGVLNVRLTGRNPVEAERLLSSNRMRSLVNELEQSGQFDQVLFDTPPVLGLADASLVAEHCDGLMLLVSLDYVDRSLPKESVARIRSSGAPLLGLVTNALKREQQSAAYGKYGYGGYGYGGYGYAAYNTSAAYAYYANDQDDTQPSDNDDSTTAVKTLKRRSLQPSSNGNGSDTAPNLRDRWRAQRQQLMKCLDN